MINPTIVEMKSELLGTLLDARMQHTKWMKEIIRDNNLHVEGDHTKCEFGTWIIQIRNILGDIEEYQNLEVPHRDLHKIFSALKHNPEQPSLREKLKKHSSELLSRIDSLEKRLNSMS